MTQTCQQVPAGAALLWVSSYHRSAESLRCFVNWALYKLFAARPAVTSKVVPLRGIMFAKPLSSPIASRRAGWQHRVCFCAIGFKHCTFASRARLLSYAITAAPSQRRSLLGRARKIFRQLASGKRWVGGRESCCRLHTQCTHERKWHNPVEGYVWVQGRLQGRKRNEDRLLKSG